VTRRLAVDHRFDADGTQSSGIGRARDAEDPRARAGARRASCAASPPTPPPAVLTATVSPGCTATARTAENDVTPIAYKAPERIQSSARGLAVRCCRSDTA
jgi:hypothetical protein